jgi:predicted dehydrogenase
MDIRLGIIGIGNMGSGHVRNIQEGRCPRVRLAAVCDVVAERCARAPGVPAFTDSRAMIRSGLVDAVLIATPHYDHTTIGIDALEQGLHVMTEKPLSVHKADCERLIAAYGKRPRREQVFAAMFNERTIPRNRKIRELVRSGELGRINRVAWITTDWFRSESYYRSGGWRATWRGEGGGILTNQCPHRLDLLQWWFGSPSRIRAFAGFGRFHDIEVEDDVTAYLEWEGGATGVFVATTGEAPGVNRLEIAAERGLVVVEHDAIRFTRNVVETSQHSRTTTEGFSGPEHWKIDIPFPARAGMHAEVLANFADAILDGAPLIAPASEGIRAVEIANAIILSAKNDQTVSLPLDAAAYLRLHETLVAGSRHVPAPAKSAAPVDLAASFGR